LEIALGEKAAANAQKHLNRETTTACSITAATLTSRKSLANSTQRGECKTMKLKTNRLWRLAGMSTLGIVLLIVVLVILFGGGYGFGWGGPGYYGGGGLVILILIVLLVLGKL
jgi:hypothetical protein